jgi:hypothetical protein
LYGGEHRMLFGAKTFRQFVSMLASSTDESEARDPWVTQMRNLPATVVSTGTDPIFQGAADFDLELIDSRTLDGHTQELIYRPTLHV